MSRRSLMLVTLVTALALALAACSPRQAEPAPTEAPTEMPTEAPAEAPTQAPEAAVPDAAVPDTEATALEGTSWQLVSYVNADGETVDAVPGADAGITFQDGSVSGNAGCNSFSGSYTVEGNQISVGPMAMTMMACEDALMAQEQAVTAALSGAATYAMDGETLQLMDADGNVLATFTPAQHATLVGPTWVATGYNNGRGGFTSLVIGTEITAVFAEDGTLSGSAGCNNYTAGYTVDGDAIQIGPAASTRKMCAEPEGVMEQEQEYLAALETAATYRIDGDTLEMRTADGALVAGYLAQPAEAETPAEEGALTPEALANMEYTVEETESGGVLLSDGYYEEPAAPGSASMTTVTLLPESIAFGAIDGVPSAAVVLVVQTGGSGSFYYLALVQEQDGAPVHVSSVLLGDRVRIASVTIEDNQIVVDMVTQGPDDPMCCPSTRVVNTYALQEGQLVETSSEVVGRVEASEDTLAGPVWQWQGSQYNNDTEAVPPDPSQYTIQFNDDGTVAVQADCNRGTGTFTADDSSISIEMMTTTLAACPEGSLEQEYLRDLGGAAIYFFQDGDLFLDIQMDSGTMRFSASDSTSESMGGMDHTAMAHAELPFDAQFIDSMIEHHEGAIAMAEAAQSEASKAELLELADAIVAAQTEEIAQMTGWRQTWYPDLAPTEGMGMAMGEMMISDDASVPFEQRFIEAMISHHQGAIDMATEAQAKAERAEIRELADAIITAQQSEIEQMKEWLDAWFE